MKQHHDIYTELNPFQDEMDYLPEDLFSESKDEIFMDSEWLPRPDIREYDDLCEYASKWY